MGRGTSYASVRKYGERKQINKEFPSYSRIVRTVHQGVRTLSVLFAVSGTPLYLLNLGRNKM